MGPIDFTHPPPGVHEPAGDPRVPTIEAALRRWRNGQVSDVRLAEHIVEALMQANQ